MMVNPTLYSFTVFFLMLFTETEAGKYCTKFSNSLYSTSLFYCSTSCCGTLYSRYCCHFTVGISAISGIVVSVLIVVCVLVAVVFICMKNKAKRGRVVQPFNSKITVVYTGTTTQLQGYNNGTNRSAQPGYYNSQSGPIQPGYYNQQYQPVQSGYQSSNPTGMVQPAYPPSYPPDSSGLTPYTGSAIPPPYNYLNPDYVPGVESNLMNSSVQAGVAQQGHADLANSKQMHTITSTPVAD